jgi:competence protein ComEC
MFSRNVPYPADSVVSGMVLGVQGDITPDMKNLFLTTGTLHTLVLSGYNITLLASVLATIFQSFSQRVRTVFSATGIAFLVGVSGVGVAALRAGIMGSLALFAVVTRRVYDPLRGLVIAYLFFFLANPYEIFADPGFHLSFIATFSIIVLYPRIEARVVRTEHRIWKPVLSTIVLSTTMPMLTLPYTMYFSGIFGLSSPIANSAASLLVPIITVAGMVLLVCSFVSPLATGVGSALGFVTKTLITVLRWCNHIPIWNTPPLSGWSVVGVYVMIVFVFCKKDIFIFFARLHKSLESSPQRHSS